MVTVELEVFVLIGPYLDLNRRQQQCGASALPMT